MDFPNYLLSALILIFGASVQGAIGFGAGLFSIPLLVWHGSSLPEAVGLALPITAVQTSFNIWQRRSHLRWRNAVGICSVRLAALPLGVWCMRQLTYFDVSTAKQVIGVTLLVILAVQTWLKVKPRAYVHGGWTLVAGVASGLLAGTLGMGGPALVLWVMAHDWSAIEQRQCLWINVLLILPVHMGLLFLTFGSPMTTALLLGVLFAPLGFLGAVLGGRVGAALSRRRLRGLMTCVLVGIAVYSIVDPMSRG